MRGARCPPPGSAPEVSSLSASEITEALPLPHDGGLPVTHETVTVSSRGRVYTTVSQRDRLGLDGKGYGARLVVGVVADADEPPDVAIGYKAAATTVRVGRDGQFTVPAAVRDWLGIEAGDTVRVSARVIEDGLAD